MLSVEEARDRILDVFDVLDSREAGVLESLGQVLAKDVTAPRDIPPLANSAMDGYAVAAQSVTGASSESPVVLRVIGAVAAGELPKERVTPGTAMRIMTGAPVPGGADAVVPFEETDEADHGADLSHIGIRVEVPPGSDVRPAGQDVRRGETVLTAGTTLRPPDAGVISSLGYQSVEVIRRPIVSILSTGDELLEPGDAPADGKIYDSNSYGITAAVLQSGGIPRRLGIARDNIESVTAKIREGLTSDLLVTSAGVSKGDYDMVKEVLATHGKIDFWSVRMRPAKPLAFGLLDADDGRRVPHLGLPGNPVSALVAFEQFGRPAIRKMMGKPLTARPTVRAVLDEPIYNTDGRRVYARAVVTKRNGVYHARLTGHQSSNLLTSMARANALAICPEDVEKRDAGEIVDVQMLDWPEEII